MLHLLLTPPDSSAKGEKAQSSTDSTGGSKMGSRNKDIVGRSRSPINALNHAPQDTLLNPDWLRLRGIKMYIKIHTSYSLGKLWAFLHFLHEV